MFRFESVCPLCLRWGLTLQLLTVVAGCQSNAGNGALIGGAAGAGIGAIIGNNSHGRTMEGALIGGAIGAIGGGLIGNEMDKNDARQRQAWDSRQMEYQKPPITKDDVIAWTASGVREDIILDRIQQSGAVFHLTTGDENQLRDVGVTDHVVQAMRDTARR